jgi:hypothetical protein
MMRGGAVIMCMVSSETPATDLPQGAVIFIVVRQVLIAFKTIWERGGRSGSFTFLTREEANASLRNCPTLEAVTTIFIYPF